MSFDRAYEYLKRESFDDRVKVFDVSSATVELAAAALGVENGKIAKSLTFRQKSGPVMVICAGDVKVSNSDYKQTFGEKAVMLTYDEVEQCIGHAVGGVCPFGINEGVSVYLDDSLKKYEKVYPACGSDNSAVELSVEELEKLSGAKGWVHVTKEANPQ